MRRFVLILLVALLMAAPAAAAGAAGTATPAFGQPLPAAMLAASCTAASSTPMAAFLAGTSSLKRGSSGAAVYELQAFLKLQGYSVGTVDGAFGSLTQTAVKAFQRDQGLSVDGVAGAATRAAVKALTQKTGFASMANSAGKILRPGDRGAEVKELQRWLKAAGHSPGTVDGVFGSLTTAAVKAFQASKPALTSDGKVGARRPGRLWPRPFTSDGRATASAERDASQGHGTAPPSLSACRDAFGRPLRTREPILCRTAKKGCT